MHTHDMKVRVVKVFGVERLFRWCAQQYDGSR